MSKIPEDLAIRIETYKLMVADDSIHSAEQAIDLARNLKVDSQHPMYHAVQNMVVVCYVRPFTAMEPFGSLSSKWGKLPDPTLQRTHDEIVKHRHQSIAHIDFEPAKVLIYPSTDSTKPDEYYSLVKLGYYPPEAYEAISQLCKNMRKRLNEAVQKNMGRILSEKARKSKPFELITEEDITLFKTLRS